jgi:hypothetical protein
MWEPRRLTTLRASTACHRDSFTFHMQLYCSTKNTKHQHFLGASVSEICIFTVKMFLLSQGLWTGCVRCAHCEVGPSGQGTITVNTGGAWHAINTRHAERGTNFGRLLECQTSSGCCKRLISRYIQPHREQYSSCECSIGPPFSCILVQSCNSTFAFSPYVVSLLLISFLLSVRVSFLPLSLHFPTSYQRLWIHSLKRNGNYIYHLL